MRLRGGLYARGATVNCLLRDAALMSSACVPDAIRRSGGWLEIGGFCGVTNMTVTRAAQLFNHRLLSSALPREAGMGLLQTLLRAAGSRDEVEVRVQQWEHLLYASVPTKPKNYSQSISPPSSHFSGGLAFLARRGSSQVVVLLL